jgi:hypothetical protein
VALDSAARSSGEAGRCCAVREQLAILPVPIDQPHPVPRHEADRLAVRGDVRLERAGNLGVDRLDAPGLDLPPPPLPIASVSSVPIVNSPAGIQRIPWGADAGAVAGADSAATGVTTTSTTAMTKATSAVVVQITRRMQVLPLTCPRRQRWEARRTW